MIMYYISQALMLLWISFWFAFFMFLCGLGLSLIDEHVIKADRKKNEQLKEEENEKKINAKKGVISE